MMMMMTKTCTQRLKARVTKRWCLEQLNTFLDCGERCLRTNQVNIDAYDYEDCSKGVVQQQKMFDLQDVNWYQ